MWRGLLALVSSILMFGGISLGAEPASATGGGANGRIAFVRYDPDQVSWDIYTINPDGSGLTAVTDDEEGKSGPAWSPDGTRIALSIFRDNNEDIYVINADGSGETRLTTGPAYDSDPAWSPDGSRIAFLRQGWIEPKIWVMNADGTEQRRLLDLRGVYDPAWSPDGTRIAFSTDYFASPGDPRADLYVMDVDGSHWTRLTHQRMHKGFDGEPSWSPDGTRIVFTRDFGPCCSDLVVVDTDGMGLTNLTNRRWEPNELWPDWQPIPCTITGTSEGDTLAGTEGDDVICGGEGDDTISTGGGEDLVTGGVGIDTLSFEAAPNGLNVDLADGTAEGWGAAAISSIESVLGSPSPDRLRGDASTNLLLGEGGDDLVRGRAGDDRVAGGAGDDRLFGRRGRDLVRGGPGWDTCRGGERYLACEVILE